MVVKRRIKVPKSESASERQQRTAVRFIQDNRYYALILKAIRSGTPNSRIAEHGIARGWFDGQNQKTVVSYLQYFRKAKPGLCRPVEEETGRDGEEQRAPSIDYLDSVFDGAASIVDEETELIRLIKLQKARLGIAFNNERQMNILMNSNRREVEELRNLIVDLAKLRGLISSNSGVNVNLIGYSETVKEDLKGIQQDEQQRNMIATLVHDLVGVVRD